MEVLIIGQSNPGGTHYQDLLREYERNLYNAQAREIIGVKLIIGREQLMV